MVKPKFTESYKALCMMEEVRKVLGVPLDGNWAIYINDPAEVMQVEHNAGEKTLILGKAGYIDTRLLAWLPTIEELSKRFGEGTIGFYTAFLNFLEDPSTAGYSKEGLSTKSEEEKWLLYCMFKEESFRFIDGKWEEIDIP